ncbi:MAG: hypothetical protein PHC51_11690 [bacterium]|nr:hypothetical protein [bacterium]
MNGHSIHGDFHQTPSLITVSAITEDTTGLEDSLRKHLRGNEVCIMLPCLWRDMHGPAMANIIAQHKAMTYSVSRLIILQQANFEQFQEAYRMWAEVPNVTILWKESDRVQRVIAKMENAGIYTGTQGKGQAVWLGSGYVVGAGESDIVALHDCDIVTFHKDMMTRLILPLTLRAQALEFSKAYFCRVKDRKLMGRVCTKFIVPLVTALLEREQFNRDEFLRFLSELRYPLSGEFAMKASLLARLRIPAGYDLEIRSLHEIFKKTSPGQRVQVDLGYNYDHHHQELKGANDSGPIGLEKMSMDIARALIQILRERGHTFSVDELISIIPDYEREAQDTIFKLHTVAQCNNLETDWNKEEDSVETFVRALNRLVRKGEVGINDSGKTQRTWNRIISEHGDTYLQALVDAVNADKAKYFA